MQKQTTGSTAETCAHAALTCMCTHSMYVCMYVYKKYIYIYIYLSIYIYIYIIYIITCTHIHISFFHTEKEEPSLPPCTYISLLLSLVARSECGIGKNRTDAETGNGSAAAEYPTGTRHRLIEAQGLHSRSPEPARASGTLQAGAICTWKCSSPQSLEPNNTEQVACGRIFNLKPIDNNAGVAPSLH